MQGCHQRFWIFPIYPKLIFTPFLGLKMRFTPFRFWLLVDLGALGGHRTGSGLVAQPRLILWLYDKITQGLKQYSVLI